MVVKDLVKDMHRSEIHRIADRKVNPAKLLAFFKTVRTELENDIFDSHLTVCESY